MDSDGRQWWLFLIIYMTGFVVTGDTYVWERVEAEVEELTKRGQIQKSPYRRWPRYKTTRESQGKQHVPVSLRQLLPAWM